MQDLADVSLAIVCPMANEGQTARRFVDEVLANCAALRSRRFFAVIDRVSFDDTLSALQAHARSMPELSVVWAPENRSVVDAYRRGYEEAVKTGADWILEIDAGFSHQPSDIPLLLGKMQEGYDCVFGSRFCPGGAMMNSSWRRYALSYGGTLLANTLLGTSLTDMTSGFQLFQRQALQAVLRCGIRSHGPFFQTEMKAHCRQMNVTEVPIQYQSPTHAVGSAALGDALLNLGRLLWARVAGRL